VRQLHVNKMLHGLPQLCAFHTAPFLSRQQILPNHIFHHVIRLSSAQTSLVHSINHYFSDSITQARTELCHLACPRKRLLYLIFRLFCFLRACIHTLHAYASYCRHTKGLLIRRKFLLVLCGVLTRVCTLFEWLSFRVKVRRNKHRSPLHCNKHLALEQGARFLSNVFAYVLVYVSMCVCVCVSQCMSVITVRE
jgi:hypothetical protein